MKYNKRRIILINEETGERKDCKSINEAARFLNTQFVKIQRAALYNGKVKDWRIFEDPETIRQHIKELEAQLQVLAGYDGEQK